MAWCKTCKKEYDAEGNCPVCGTELEDNEACGTATCTGDCASCPAAAYEEACTGDCDPGIWPLDDEGQPVKPALLTTVTGTALDYEMALAQLRSYGIPSVKDFPEGAEIFKLYFGFAGTGMDIYVPENMVEIARELMQPVEGDDET